MDTLIKPRMLRLWSLLLSAGLALLTSGCPGPGEGHDPSGVGNDLAGLWQDVPTPCSSDEECATDAKGPCQEAFCELPAGTCRVTSRPDGSPCTTGNACVIGESCSHGMCTGGMDKPPCQTISCGIDECGNTCPGCPAGQECENGH
ncbi:MAG: hypothetical protein GY778_20900, partial [bacterium]|nr:hypothetical protein [bacterium]